MSLQGKLAVISGASRGIGRAIAEELAMAGVHVILLARSGKDLEDTASQIRRNGGKTSAFALDIGDEASVATFAAELENMSQPVDFLINNAGIGSFQPVIETGGSLWDEVMKVNVKGTFLMCRYLVPLMQKQKKGHIINIASDVSKRTFAGGAMYCASKYAQDAFSSVLRKEVRPEGIKVSVIYPGLVDTYFNESKPGKVENKDWLRPQDVAGAVKYVLLAPPHVVVDELMMHPLSQDY